MTVTVTGIYNKGFIQYLKKQIMKFLIVKLNSNKLSAFDDYLQSIYGDKTITAKRIIFIGLSNLVCSDYGDKAIISIDDKICYPNTNVKILDLCRLINYGSADLKPYPIFTLTFNHFNSNIEKYSERYADGLE